MKKQIIQRLSMLLVLLFGVISSSMAVDRLQIERAGIEPGETVAVPISLENDQTFYGFQLDIAFPEGLDAVQKNGKADVILSSRLDNSFQLVTNKLADGKLRILAFSMSHQAITGNSGALFYINVSAAEDFSGGQLSATNIRMVGEGDRDVVLPDLTIKLGTEHNNHFYIQDFKIAVGETKTVSLILDNETEFTAFQTDLYLPEGISIVPNSAKMTSRGYASHSISMKSFSDGRTRIACLSPNSDAFRGNRGALLTIDFTANKDAAETSKIQMKNQTFVTPHVKEYKLPNSECTVTTERALVESITLEPTSLVLVEGNSQQLTPTVLPTFASTKDLKWSSSAPNIATVSAPGLVTALKSGNCVITAAAVDGSGVTATCSVTVTENPVTSVILNRSTATLKATETVQLSGSILPANASNKNLVWTTSDENIATVSESGLVTAVAVGEVTITATSQSTPDISATCRVSVVPTPVASITLSQTSVSLKATETVSLTATVAPETATIKDVTWTSDNPKVATVDENGVITAVTAGEAVITATATDGSGVKATCSVSVIATLAEGVTIETPDKTTFKAGESIKLNATVLPETTTDKTITWTSSNLAVATVDENGNVTAVGVGTVIITATTSNGKTYTITLTVEPTLATSLTLNRTSASLKVANTLQLSAIFTPATTTNQTVEWSTSNESIAKVNTSGLVTAKALGTCVITATAKDGSGVSASCELVVGETPAESITISPKGPFTIKIGETVSLSATVLPETATDKSVSWLAQTSAVKVDQNGLVTGLAVGDSWVSATNSAGHNDFVNFTVTPILVEKIEIENQLSFEVGQTKQLHAVVSPSNATNTALNWTVKDSSVASVDNNGNVTALKLGATEITVAATDGSGVTSTVKVNVIPTMAESIAINTPTSTTLKAGESIKLNATVLPETTTDKSINWSTSDAAIATVDSEGNVIAVGVGTVEITATTSNGKTSTITLTIDPTLAESITLTPAMASILIGESISMVVSVSPATTTNKSVTWTSSNPEVASVDDSGNVTGLDVGNVEITATTADGSSLKAVSKISVNPILAQSVTIGYDGQTNLYVGVKAQLSATVLPENTTDKSIAWRSLNPTVASVSETGLVTALAIGNVTITATTTNGQTAQIEFAVVPTPVSAITFDKTSVKLKATESVKIIATVVPEDATNKNINWTSSNNSVASVDAEGVVTAIAIGEAVITATATDGSGVFNTVEVQVEPIYAESITIVAEGSTTLRDGETVQLRAVFVPENTSDKRVTWDAGPEINATIDENGLFTAGAVPRVVGVVARSIGTPGVGGTIEINVVETPVESVEITSDPLVLLPGESKEVTVSVNPSTATDKTITWSVSDESIIKLQEFDSSVAVINAIAPGQAYLYAEASNGVNTSLMVTVNTIPVSEIILSKQELRLNVSETYQFEADVLPANASNKAIRWESSNAEIGTVDETGFFTAIAPGETVITCYATDESGVSTQCQTVVIQPVTSIMLNEHKLELEKDKSIQLVATIEPVNATDKRVTWSSSEPEIVSVNEDGVIEALKEGEAIITVATLDGSSLDDECKVTVSINSGIEKITIDDIKVSVNGNTIVVELESSLVPVRLYMINGTEIPAKSRIEKQVFFSDLDTGYYIISLGKQALKIRV
ncbi:MAG: Ig-like domain-containing protein [Porphyromonas sp.]|uniref:Ig-like domain-containing protein n=1 Tax=Porphyromonas sp. TaxID=1924944 RepID=UPI002A7504CA|nr:Ig-like domain-containing protein [Porphyromonas sp.]MDD6928748.1 Ig-like domain-containing protein [Bacteroidales bacterium]MDY3112344.1 Ig-like domain-containing protein [Porphyromonas sp.]